MKKFLLYLLLASTLLLTFASCHKRKDPFVSSSDAPTIGSHKTSFDASEDTKNSSSETKNGPSDTETESFEENSDSFYSMTAVQSANKYGLVEWNARFFDGKYQYVTERELDGVLYRYPYGAPEKKTAVCPDPLCTHRPGSGCVFENLSLLRTWCYEGKIFFILETSERVDGERRTISEFCMFDEAKGKKQVLDKTESMVYADLRGGLH